MHYQKQDKKKKKTMLWKWIELPAYAYKGWRMVFASIREHAEHCDFFASTSRNKKFALWACEQRKNLGSTSKQALV